VTTTPVDVAALIEDLKTLSREHRGGLLFYLATRSPDLVQAALDEYTAVVPFTRSGDEGFRAVTARERSPHGEPRG